MTFTRPTYLTTQSYPPADLKPDFFKQASLPSDVVDNLRSKFTALLHQAGKLRPPMQSVDDLADSLFTCDIKLIPSYLDAITSLRNDPHNKWVQPLGSNIEKAYRKHPDSFGRWCLILEAADLLFSSIFTQSINEENKQAAIEFFQSVSLTKLFDSVSVIGFDTLMESDISQLASLLVSRPDLEQFLQVYQEDRLKNMFKEKKTMLDALAKVVLKLSDEHVLSGEQKRHISPLLRFLYFKTSDASVQDQIYTKLTGLSSASSLASFYISILSDSAIEPTKKLKVLNELQKLWQSSGGLADLGRQEKLVNLYDEEVNNSIRAFEKFDSSSDEGKLLEAYKELIDIPDEEDELMLKYLKASYKNEMASERQAEYLIEKNKVVFTEYFFNLACSDVLTDTRSYLRNTIPPHPYRRNLQNYLKAEGFSNPQRIKRIIESIIELDEVHGESNLSGLASVFVSTIQSEADRDVVIQALIDLAFLEDYNPKLIYNYFYNYHGADDRFQFPQALMKELLSLNDPRLTNFLAALADETDHKSSRLQEANGSWLEKMAYYVIDKIGFWNLFNWALTASGELKNNSAHILKYIQDKDWISLYDDKRFTNFMTGLNKLIFQST